MSIAHVSLTPTSASGLLCNASPLATAIAVATTEADVRALASVVRGQHAPVGGDSWAEDVYGGESQPTAAAVASLLPRAHSLSVTTDGASGGGEGGLSAMESSTTGAAAAAAAGGRTGLQRHRTSSSSPSQPRLSVVRSASVAEAESSQTLSAAATDAGDGAASSFVLVVAPAATSAARQRSKNVSWQCGLCGYHVLAMDQDGNPLPFATSAYGSSLPLLCPRCRLSHSSWQPATPFSEQGDHLNMPTTYSNRYVAAAAAAGAPARRATSGPAGHDGEAANATAPQSQRVGLARLLTARSHPNGAAGVGINTVGSSSNASGLSAGLRHRRAYYCGHCNRRLLRVDANGELVDMDRERDGSIRPICCPGCGDTHGDWVVRPYAVHR